MQHGRHVSSRPGRRRDGTGQRGRLVGPPTSGPPHGHPRTGPLALARLRALQAAPPQPARCPRRARRPPHRSVEESLSKVPSEPEKTRCNQFLTFEYSFELLVNLTFELIFIPVLLDCANCFKLFSRGSYGAWKEWALVFLASNWSLIPI